MEALTFRGMASPLRFPHHLRVFDPRNFDSIAFVEEGIKRAGSQAALARLLDIAPARISDFFKPKGEGQRRLTMEEGLKMAAEYNMPPCESVSADKLEMVLRVCLRYAPKGGWSAQDVRNLAEAVEYGLEILKTTSTSPPSSDALAVAANAIAQRLQQPPS